MTSTAAALLSGQGVVGLAVGTEAKADNHDTKTRRMTMHHTKTQLPFLLDPPPAQSKVPVAPSLLESAADRQVVKILDSGSGITTEELPFLFQRFYQGHSDRQAKGTGLGLYLCRQIIEAHQGIIWADNRDPVGAVFGFKLPIHRSGFTGF